jgi:DNA polymerase-3 subunit beta
MQLKQVPRDALLKPLQAVSGIVERRHTLPILSNVLLEQKEGELYVTATDLEMQITAKSELKTGSDQAITVGARKLQDLLRALPDESILQVDPGANRVTIKSGKSRFNLQTLPAADFPRIAMSADQKQTISVAQRDLRRLLRLVEFAMAQQDIRYYLNGMLLVLESDKLIAVATDGHRLSYASMTIGGNRERQEVILPRKTVQELSKLLADSEEPIHIDLLANQIRFRFGSIELISKVIDGKFPDYNRVIPAGYTRSCQIPRLTLLQALQRAAILANEKFRGVRLVLSDKSLKIICTNSDQEEAEEELETGYSGDPLDIAFNINYVLDVLTNLSDSEVNLAFGDGSSSALVTVPEREDYKYVVMPMRI